MYTCLDGVAGTSAETTHVDEHVQEYEKEGELHLSADQARHSVCESQFHAHLEALVEGIDVAQVAPGNDDPVRHLPVKLLADLDGCSLLAL